MVEYGTPFDVLRKNTAEPQRDDPEQTAMQWEYQLAVGTLEGFDDLTKRLDTLGAEGWEAVGIAGDSNAENFTVLLKRDKQRGKRADVEIRELERLVDDAQSTQQN